GPTAELLDDPDERHQRVADTDHWPPVDRDRHRDDRGGRLARVPGGEVLVVLNEGDVAGLGLGEGAGVGNRQIAVPEEFSPDGLGEFPDGAAHGGPSSLRAAGPGFLAVRRKVAERRGSGKCNRPGETGTTP